MNDRQVTEPTGLTPQSQETILRLLSQRQTQEMYDSSASYQTQTKNSQPSQYSFTDSRIYKGIDRDKAQRKIIDKRNRIINFMLGVMNQNQSQTTPKDHIPLSQHRLIQGFNLHQQAEIIRRLTGNVVYEAFRIGLPEKPR